MKPRSRLPSRTPPFILSPRDEQMLRAIHQYRYLTAEDMAYLQFSPTSVTYVRKRLSTLSGGSDLTPHAYLCRFPLPKAGVGNQHKIFTLGSKGRSYLQREAGLPVDWYFRPSKYPLGISHLRHALLLTRLVVAAHYWSRRQATYTLTHCRMSYELARIPGLNVIPDAWVMFESDKGDKYPIMIEIDRGMEFQAKFTRHLKARIEYIRSGEYARTFGTTAVIIAYVTTGQRPEYRDTRLATMMTWTQQLLAELGRESWAGIFRFASVVYDKVYEQGLFDQPVWRRPDAAQPGLLLRP